MIALADSIVFSHRHELSPQALALMGFEDAHAVNFQTDRGSFLKGDKAPALPCLKANPVAGLVNVFLGGVGQTKPFRQVG